MKISQDNPPNIEVLKIAFKVTDRTVFTYGDTIYNPGNNYIDKSLEKHEEVHSRQQGDDPEYWWKRYLLDPDFRLAQEIEAYQAQYRHLKSIVKDRNQLAKWAHLLASDLSSELYGKIISYQEALNAVKSQITIKFKV